MESATPSAAASPTESLPPYARDRAFWGMTTTQFLGAFNDNLFKQLVLMLCTAYVLKIAARGDHWQSLAQAAFALPFVLFSGLGGYLSDRYSKRGIVVLCKVAEVVVMLLGAVSLWAFPPDTRIGLLALCGVLFLMGTQSAFFGPAKYGILPEMLRERDLPAANGVIQMTTFLAIILGTVAAGHAVVRFADELWVVTLMCVSVAIAGTLAAFSVRRTAIAQPGLKFHPDALWISRDLRSLLRRDRPLLAALLITTLFWFVGGAVLPAVNGLGAYHLRLGADRTSFLAAMMGVGIAIGCPVAGLMSRGQVRFDLVRLGAGGIFLCLMIVGLLPQFGLTVTSAERLARCSLAGLGFCGGLFAVPLQVFLQARPPKEQKGRMIGSMNLVNWIGILLSSAFHFATTSAFGKASTVSFLVLGLLMLPVAIAFRPNVHAAVPPPVQT